MSEAIPPTFSEFAVGSQIAGYRLEEQIGHGGMAVVYRAYDARLDRRVALKILAPGLALDEAFRHRFIRESKAAAAVDHPHIIPVFDAGEASGVLFIAMRFVQGRDVGTLLHRTGSLAPARATEIIAQVASALDAAHARGLVHRDVKPANMLLDESTGSDRQDHVYLTDFGLSKQSLSQTGITSQGQVLGTLDYIAPEQIEGRPVDGRADLYALACAAFELLSGAPPFKRSGGLAVVWAQLSEPPPPLTARRAGLPPAIDDVLARAMAKSPADRFRRCGEFAVALREVLGLRTAEPGRTGGRPRPAPATQIAVLRADLPPASPVPFTAPAGGALRAGDALPAGDAVTARDALLFGDAVPVEEAVSAGDAAPPGDAGSEADTTPPLSLPLPWRAGSDGNAAFAGDALSAGNGPSAGVAWAAGDAAAARDQAPPQASRPAPAADPYERLYSGRRYEAGPYAGRSHEAGPPAEAASGMPAARSTRPGLTEPGGPLSGQRSYAGDAAARPPWWRSRGALLAAAVVVVLGIVAGVVLSAHGDGSGKMTNGLASKIPGLSSAPATAPQLHGVASQKVGLGGHPFGVAVTPDGKYSFVSLGNSVAVLSNDGGSLAPKQVATIPAPGAKKSEAITSDGQYLLAATGSGAYVINVNDAKAGHGRGAIMGTMTSPGGSQSVEVSISPDGHFVFMTLQSSADVAVFNLQKAMTGGFGTAGFVGMVPLGPAAGPQRSVPVGIAQSLDGRWLYVTSEITHGRLYVINMHLAETDPVHAVRNSAAVGSGPARIIVSADGTVIWVTDRDSNALVAISAAKLLTTPSQSLIARVSVGRNPIGLAFVKGGKEIVVADANLHGTPGADNLALISTQNALAQDHGALLGYIPAGATPRELAVEPDGQTLLSTDNNSGQLEAVNVGSLP